MDYYHTMVFHRHRLGAYPNLLGGIRIDIQRKSVITVLTIKSGSWNGGFSNPA
jgi:hypothetical protein